MTRIAQILALIDEAYARQAWHGPNLRGSLRGVPAAVALWRPAPGRHNIWEIALHTAYWKYAVLRRLTGRKRGSFPLEGSNWFTREGALGAGQWKEELAMLGEQHRQMRECVATLSERALDKTLEGSRVTTLRLVQGIAAHDVYHAGQIQLLKRLAPGE
ncbi:MAG TPA: DinB family protein [Bacteroidota bacterium]